MMSRIATMPKLTTTLDPPYDMNGSVTPVSGTKRTMPPIMMNA